MPYYIADNMAVWTDTPYKTKAAALKARAAIVREAAARCRHARKRCTVVKSGNVVTINVGGKQSASMWNRFAIVKR